MELTMGKLNEMAKATGGRELARTYEVSETNDEWESARSAMRKALRAECTRIGGGWNNEAIGLFDVAVPAAWQMASETISEIGITTVKGLSGFQKYSEEDMPEVVNICKAAFANVAGFLKTL